MKAAEDFLAESLPKDSSWALPPKAYKAILKAMQLYSDQQNKELREELSTMKAMFDFDKTRAEIQRLTKEVERWKAERDNAVNSSLDQRGLNQALAKEITRLRELLGRANKLLNWNDVSAEKLYYEINQTLKP